MNETTIAAEEVAANAAAERVAEIAKEVVKEIVKEAVEHVTVQRVDNGFIIVCPTRKHKIANNIEEVIAIISADFAA